MRYRLRLKSVAFQYVIQHAFGRNLLQKPCHADRRTVVSKLRHGFRTVGNGLVVHLHRLSYALRSGEYAHVGTRVDVPKQRHYVQANLVSHHVGLQIRAVGHVVLTETGQVALDVLSTYAQQWPHYPSVNGAYAAETVYACATQQIDQHGFNTVLTMVSHADDIQIEVVKQARKIVVAQVARRHFDAHLVQLRIRTGVEVNQMQWNIES